ncbi:type II toxin-antitoxin system VapC family toxin [Paenibacillus odorifer]|uniref:type II toxin-antitoxin system VapC family toxin n=1 Tax=Paenibacillus odorifer TaxID=189426 RepID=UPI000B9FF68B|nr:type II toxin-antitoxin system VapC family toxin [Paenibacillus odorifer]OZQ68286.1 hypothetical protein CA596_25800 [Paenibacillus odorifer]
MIYTSFIDDYSIWEARVGSLGGYLLDTNIIIYYFESLPQVVRFMKETFQQPRNELFLSVITEAELLSHPSVRTDELLKEMICGFIESSHDVIEVSRRIAILSGDIRSHFHHKYNRKIKLPDVLIAATAITLGATLISNNDKDFLDISSEFGLEYLNPVRPQE